MEKSSTVELKIRKSIYLPYHTLFLKSIFLKLPLQNLPFVLEQTPPDHHTMMVRGGVL